MGSLWAGRGTSRIVLSAIFGNFADCWIIVYCRSEDEASNLDLWVLKHGTIFFKFIFHWWIYFTSIFFIQILSFYMERTIAIAGQSSVLSGHPSLLQLKSPTYSCQPRSRQPQISPASATRSHWNRHRSSLHPRGADSSKTSPRASKSLRTTFVPLRICIFSIFMEQGLDFYGTRDFRNLGSIRSETPS